MKIHSSLGNYFLPSVLKLKSLQAIYLYGLLVLFAILLIVDISFSQSSYSEGLTSKAHSAKDANATLPHEHQSPDPSKESTDDPTMEDLGFSNDSLNESTNGGVDSDFSTDSVWQEPPVHVSFGLVLIPRYDFSKLNSNIELDGVMDEKTTYSNLSGYQTSPTLLMDARLAPLLNWETGLSGTYKDSRSFIQAGGKYMQNDALYTVYSLSGNTSFRFYPSPTLRIKPMFAIEYKNLPREEFTPAFGPAVPPRTLRLSTNHFTKFSESPSDLEDSYNLLGKIEAVLIRNEALVNILFDYQFQFFHYWNQYASIKEDSSLGEYFYPDLGGENKKEIINTASMGYFYGAFIGVRPLNLGLKISGSFKHSNYETQKNIGLVPQILAEFALLKNQKVWLKTNYSFDLKRYYQWIKAYKITNTINFGVMYAPTEQLSITLVGNFSHLFGSNIGESNKPDDRVRLDRIGIQAIVQGTFDLIHRRDRDLLLPDTLTSVGSTGQSSSGCAGGVCK